MTFEVTDLTGELVSEGDLIAAAFRIGNVAVLRLGTVTGFGERGNKLTVEVNWDVDSSRPGSDVNINGGIEADLKRFVKIGY